MTRICIIGDFTLAQVDLIINLGKLDKLPIIDIGDVDSILGKAIPERVTFDELKELDFAMCEKFPQKSTSRAHRRGRKVKNGVPEYGKIKPIKKL